MFQAQSGMMSLTGPIDGGPTRHPLSIIDTLTGRKTRWFSWVGLGLSFAALIVAFSEKSSFTLTAIAGLTHDIDYQYRTELFANVSRIGNVGIFCQLD